MRLVHTAELSPNSPLSPDENHQVYCGLDSAVTLEIWQALEPKLAADPLAAQVYAFERALQGPYLEIMQRGFLVNEPARRKAAEALRERVRVLQDSLNYLAIGAWGRGLNPNSPAQMKDFLYSRRGLFLPEQWISKKGVKKLSTDREALEKLDLYLHARPFVAIVLLIRDLLKQLSVFECEIDADGRFRAGYNIAGTETGRPSSSTNAFGTASNAQNISPALRYVFSSDPGKKMAVIDLEQVEARDVGFFCGCLFGDWKFLDACECLTADHEVLTPEGWVSIANQPAILATWKNKEISFTTVQKWNKGETKELLDVSSLSLSILATPNHTMPVFNNKGRLIKKPLSEIRNYATLTAPNTGVFSGGAVSLREVELIAAFQADGTRDCQGKVHWSFTKARKIKILQNLLQELGYKYSRYELGSGATRFYLHQGQGQENWPKEAGKEILTWDQQTLTKFCSSHTIWDGSISGTNLRICAKSRAHLDWLATAYYLTGKATNITAHKDNYWMLCVRTNKFLQYRSAKISSVSLSKPLSVYCPTVESGFFLVRRGGKIFVSGNSGDLHTNNAKLVWPERQWTGDPKRDRSLAEEVFYREFSYRDMAKRGGHLSNYYGTAWTAGRSLKVPVKVMEEFQARYIRGGTDQYGRPITPAYPSISRWWQWTAQQLQTVGQITTPFGRRRHFFGRVGDDATLREAIAFLPQSTTADRMNLGLWRVWRHEPRVELLAQTYDSISFQYDESADEEDILQSVLSLIRVELFSPSGRSYVVPGEAKIGWNWGSASPANPEGLVKWKPGWKDSRVRGVGRGRIAL